MSSIGCQRHELEIFYTISFDEHHKPLKATYGFVVENRFQQMCPLKDARGLTADQIRSLPLPQFRNLPDHLNKLPDDRN